MDIPEIAQKTKDILNKVGLLTKGSILTDLSATKEENQPLVSPVIDQQLIKISGQDSLAFLQNMTTQDVLQANTETACYTGFCNPQGRLWSSGYLFKKADHYYLLLPTDLIEHTIKKLNMYRLRSEVKIENYCENSLIFFTYTPHENEKKDWKQINHTSYTKIQLPYQRQFWIIDPNTDPASLQTLFSKYAPCVASLDHVVDIAHGIPRLSTQTQDHYLPQMLHFESQAVNGLSFKKGCYPGQEVVARTQYRGKLKRHLYRFQSTCLLQTAEPVFSSETHQSCGEILTCVFLTENKYESLAVLRDEQHNSQLYCNRENPVNLSPLSLPGRLGHEN